VGENDARMGMWVRCGVRVEGVGCGESVEGGHEGRGDKRGGGW